MSKDIAQFDSWFDPHTGPAALVIRELLVSVEGDDGVIFPPTFAPSKDKTFPGGYNIDGPSSDGKSPNVCLIDSVGSQANRAEPIFKSKPYATMVPQLVVVAGEHHISIFDAGHRAGDALLRCSSLAKELQAAFRAVLKGDAWSLAKIAPTSLVFGVWDSRDTQAKLPRLVSSTIRAFNVRELTRSAQYNPPVDYKELDVITQSEKEKAESDSSDILAKRGYVHQPATNTHGGVIVDGEIRRDATLSLAAMQRVEAGSDEGKTRQLRRYILGLSLVSLTANTAAYLRQGCNLVPKLDTPRTFKIVGRDGSREDFTLTHQDAVNYAQSVAQEFGVGKNREVPFDKTLSAKDKAAGAKSKKKATKKK